MKTFKCWIMMLGLSVAFTSCAPPLQMKERTPPKTDFTPQFNELQETAMNGGVESFPLAWNGTINTNDYFELVTNLLEQSQLTQNLRMKRAAQQLVDKFEATKNSVNKVNFEATPFLQLLIARAEPEVRSTIVEIDAGIEKDMEKLKNLIVDLNKEFEWPKKIDFDQSIVLVQSFLDKLILSIPLLKLQPVFEKPLMKELKTQGDESLKMLRGYSEQIKQPKTLSAIITAIEEIVTNFDVELDKKNKKLIADGKRVGKKIDKYKNADGALDVLLEIWLMLDEKGRAENIKPVSADLYDFLNGKSESTIRCIVRPGCISPWQDFLATFFVKPKLEDYGLEKLRRKLNESAHAYALSALEEEVSKTLPTLSQMVIDKICQKIAEERKEIALISSDVVKFIRLKLIDWGKKNFDKASSDLSSYEKPLIEVTMDRSHNVNLEGTGSDSMQSSSAAIGASLETYSWLMNSNTKNNKHFTRVFMNQLNKVLGFGGVEFRPGYINLGLVRSVESANIKFSLRIAPNSPQSYVLVDFLPLKTEYTTRSESLSLNVSAKSQSLLFGGLVSFMEYLKDWNANDFDLYLGKQDAAQLFSPDGQESGQKLFPKDEFFKLIFAHTANMLTNVTKEKTPFILFPESGQRLWADQMDQATAPVTMVGVVDIKAGVKSDIVRSENVSRWISAFGKFLAKTQDIEKTKSKELIEKDLATGKSPIDLINENKVNIMKLMVGLGNLLSSQMINKDGLVYETLKVQDLSNIGTTHNLMDQLLAIDALLTLHEVAEMKSYLWSALSIYEGLQKHINLKTNFYEIGEVKVADPVVLSFMVKTMNHLLPHLKIKEQEQLRYQIGIWNYHLERLD